MYYIIFLSTVWNVKEPCYIFIRSVNPFVEQLSPRNITETPLEANNDTSAESASDPQAVGAQAIMDISQVQSEQQTQGEVSSLLGD